jgi:hypothetical protein
VKLVLQCETMSGGIVQGELTHALLDGSTNLEQLIERCAWLEARAPLNAHHNEAFSNERSHVHLAALILTALKQEDRVQTDVYLKRAKWLTKRIGATGGVLAALVRLSDLLNDGEYALAAEHCCGVAGGWEWLQPIVNQITILIRRLALKSVCKLYVIVRKKHAAQAIGLGSVDEAQVDAAIAEAGFTVNEAGAVVHRIGDRREGEHQQPPVLREIDLICRYASELEKHF